ncbi:MAG: hypothetical protein Q8N51_00175 [Gammaproteobacteria bacterium]|nr:hypothetical protein [Gammaproteobacteria bacterium]
MKNKSAPKITLPYIIALRSELEVKGDHAHLTVKGPPVLMEKIVRGLRAFELVVRSPGETLVRCLYTKGFPAFEFRCETANTGATFGSHQTLTTLSIWKEDPTGQVKKLCERPAQLFVPSPVAAANNVDLAPNQPAEPAPMPFHDDLLDGEERIFIASDGPAITASNFWDSPMAGAGKFAVSGNARSLRVLVPDSLQHVLADMLRGVSWIRVAALPLAEWSEDRVCTQWTFEDFSASPYLLALSPGAFLERIPRQGDNFTIAFWVRRDGQPHRHAEFPGHWVTMSVLPQHDLPL